MSDEWCQFNGMTMISSQLYAMFFLHEKIFNLILILNCMFWLSLLLPFFLLIATGMYIGDIYFGIVFWGLAIISTIYIIAYFIQRFMHKLPKNKRTSGLFVSLLIIDTFILYFMFLAVGGFLS